MKIRFSAPAVTDLEGHIEYYAEVSDKLRDDFLAQVQQALWLLSQHPEVCPEIRNGIRRFTIQRFPIGIFYTIETSEELWVVSILHLKRNPDTINNRLDSNEV